MSCLSGPLTSHLNGCKKCLLKCFPGVCVCVCVSVENYLEIYAVSHKEERSPVPVSGLGLWLMLCSRASLLCEDVLNVDHLWGCGGICL